MSAQTKEIFLKDYKEANYLVSTINLEVDIHEEETLVTNTTCFELNTTNNDNSLELDGAGLELKSIWIDGVELSCDKYQVDEKKLYLKGLPTKFELKTKVIVDPAKNFSGEGFYQSGDIYCTQCEAEGFRRITYYLDRPDVMATFKTKLIADKKRFPMLLANGNNIENGELADGRHFSVWEDPFKKPAYLFAMVAGDLGVVKDTFTTVSGRTVALEIYVDHGNEDKCDHAMKSLQNSMKWDEEKFGLEYDLDIYMVVAVDSFNMGAMENKGLNIFNSAYVLAKKETATDRDFQGIEGVIGHEYFHNWTGNRVTCRDWFQLTLKEGLTVFRDQEFSSDMLSRSVKRIDDVKSLWGWQFPEDQGPLSHPIKPKSFVEISNFYTATIYEKGSEVIRMIHTLIGAVNFRKGMDLYFERHDGQAVTTEDFVAAMSDAADYDLDQFKVWYDQNGTPKLKIETDYNETEKSFKLKITQETKLNNNDYTALHMPFHLSLYASNGEKLKIDNGGKYELKDKESVFIFNDISSPPVMSLNENYTAPVIIDYAYTQEELSTLMAYDQDDFNRYNSSYKLIQNEIENLREQLISGNEMKLSDTFYSAYKILLTDETLDPAFKAYAISIPGVMELNNKREKFDFDYLGEAIDFMKFQLASNLQDQLVSIINELEQKGEFSLSAKAMGERDLKAVALNLLYSGKTGAAYDLIYSHFQNATNMTEEYGALAALSKNENPYREKATQAFYTKWKDETLIMQKWLSLQARSDDSNVAKIQDLEKLEIYDKKVPNLLRSLISGFAAGNFTQFHAKDGSGYKFYADKIIEVDGFNPQIAAGMCKRFGFLNKLDESRSKLLTDQLLRIKAVDKLSSDTLEVVTKNLG
ncbi:MAG: aminopeptidase N [Halobacteriovoraceae bacterium]|jgi:aminopeptidase N|nr:aminopeptidase N [Halobacteriovoraceae bacterium]